MIIDCQVDSIIMLDFKLLKTLIWLPFINGEKDRSNNQQIKTHTTPPKVKINAECSTPKNSYFMTARKLKV